MPTDSAAPPRPPRFAGDTPGAADARAAMVARLEESGELGPGPVREALLALPRQILMPQAYVRRSAPGEVPLRWDLLDFSRPDRRYEDDLAESPFSEVDEHRFPVRRVWTPEKVLGYLRSTSFARSELFGDRHPRFEAEARALLERHAAEEGGLVEETVFDVLLARRPGGAR